MPENTTNQRKHALVIGASMAGLFAARVLSDHFEKVTVIERDPVNDFPESRKGQAQTRHIHGLLAQGLSIINSYFPGIEQELVEGGAVVADMGEVLHWYQYGDYRKQFKSGLRSITLSRPYLELHIRRRVMGLHNVQLLSPCAVRELVTNEDKTQIIGTHMEKRQGEGHAEMIAADLIVDASGRGSSTPKWLAGFGYEPPREEEVKIRVGYATRIYKRKPNPAANLQVQMISPTAPEGKRGAFIFPIEEDRWIVTAGGASGHYPPDDEADFVEFIRTLPTSDIFDIISRTEPLTDIITYRYPVSVRRHYEELQRFPNGYLVIGDAVASFNPIYGQGMTSAAMQAEILDQTLKQGPGMKNLWQSFFKRVAKVVDIPWQLAVGEDFRYPETEGKKPPFTDLLNAYIAKVHKATHRDTVVYAQFLRVVNLMAPPLSLTSPGIFWRVMKNG